MSIAGGHCFRRESWRYGGGGTGNTAVCNNNDGGSYRNRCFMVNPRMRVRWTSPCTPAKTT
ncbi:MAG: hypothetical protein H6662_07770 [Ardenticatenaceae bacterium]|nr:hypothetical protein [Ardenticatenaceae bacterium]